jgi:hypothetical protein
MSKFFCPGVAQPAGAFSYQPCGRSGRPPPASRLARANSEPASALAVQAEPRTGLARSAYRRPSVALVGAGAGQSLAQAAVHARGLDTD